MNWLNRLERKFGRFGIRNLTMYIIGAYVLGYLLQILYPNIMTYLSLNPYEILHGQVWRIVTWLLIPPGTMGIFTIIMLFFYYSLGNSLERTWGTFRYNVYIFSGVLLTILGAFFLYAFDSLVLFRGVPDAMLPILYAKIFGSFSTYYISLSIFLAFAASYPDMQIMLYFVIPIKIKWLAYLDIALLLLDILKFSNARNWSGVIVIIVSLLNFIIFFVSTRKFKRISPREIHRRTSFSRQVHNSTGIAKHKCAICGRTSNDNDALEFRFCSKCNGNYEYCQEHLFTHEHIK